MWKQAWRSYLISLHPRYLRKAYDEGKLFWVLYWLVIYPVIMSSISDNPEIFQVIYLLMFRLVPFFLMAWSDIGSKYLMTKMMFLSPMKEEERKEYIKCVLVIKIGVSLLLGICIELIISMFYSSSILRVVILAIMNLSMGIATYISLEAFGKMDKKVYAIVKEKITTTKGRWMNTFIIVFAMVVDGLISILDIGAEASLALFCKIFISVTTILFMGLDVKIVCSHYKATIALAGDYELSFHILGKVEKKVKFDMFEKEEVTDV